LSKLLKNSIIGSGFALGTALLNFASQIIIAAYFGANRERDAFFAASVIPTYISTIVIGSLGAVFLPKLVDIKVSKPGALNGLVDGVITFAIMFLTSLGLLIAVFSDRVVSLLFSGFGPAETELTSELIVLLAPSIVLQPLSSVLGAVYHAEKKFLLPAACFIMIPLTAVLSAVLLHGFLGIRSLAIGTSIGYLITFVVLQVHIPIPYKIRPRAMFDSNDARECLWFSLPWIFGGFIYRGGTVIERMVASRFPAGVMSYLGYAGGLITTLSAVTMNGIATTIFPTLAESWTLRDFGRLRYLFGLSLKFTLVVCIPIIAAIVAYDRSIIVTLFERGAFTRNDTLQVSALLSIMSVTFLFNCLNTVPAKLLYITNTSWLAIINGFAEVGIYIVGSIVLSGMFSYVGIAYAQVLSTACSTLLVVSILQFKFKVLNAPSLGRDLLKIVLFGVFIYLCMISYKLFFDDQTLFISVLFGSGSMVIYFFLITSFLHEGRLIPPMIMGKLNKIFRMQ
jgi:putative peptidoglycan lipid II flippase